MQAELLAAAEEEASKTEKMILPKKKPIIVETSNPEVHVDDEEAWDEVDEATVEVEVLEPIEETEFNSAGR